MIYNRLNPVLSDLTDDRDGEDLTVLEINAGEGGNVELLQEYFQSIELQSESWRLA